ncbi:oligosaccharide flippase family protein [Phenylobacterium conjunctum]|uniref:Polysaccharide biosynthesis C-terminal domain-containing protein n=1 Tax=Phenylobacterium conjunctum TaxID=1298959 RepID=A0ABW3T4K2_9CAUL
MKLVLAYGVGTFVPRFCALLAIFVYSRLLTVNDFGLYVLAIAIGEFSDQVTSNWFRVGFLRFYHPGRIADGPYNLNSLFKFYAYCTLVGTALVWPISFIMVRTHTNWVAFAGATSLYVVGNGAVAACVNVFRGEGRAFAFAAMEMLRPLGALAAGVTATVLLVPTFRTCAYFGFGCHAAIGLTVLARIWPARGQGASTKGWVTEIVHYAWPLFFSCLLIALLNISDRSQLQWLLGPNAVALYAAAYAVGRQPIDVLLNAINVGSFTELVKAFDADGPTAGAAMLGKHITILLGLGLPAVAGVAALAAPIVHTLFDDRYWQAAPPLVPLAAGMALLAGLKSFGFDQAYYMLRRTGVQVVTLLVGAALGIVAGFLLVRSMGLVGAAYGAILGNLSALVVSGFIVYKLLPPHLIWSDIVKILFSVTLMVLALHAYPVANFDLWSLAGAVAVGAGTYLLSLVMLDTLGAHRLVRRLAGSRFRTS